MKPRKWRTKLNGGTTDVDREEVAAMVAGTRGEGVSFFYGKHQSRLCIGLDRLNRAFRFADSAIDAST
jgi:hypothetical protein